MVALPPVGSLEVPVRVALLSIVLVSSALLVNGCPSTTPPDAPAAAPAAAATPAALPAPKALPAPTAVPTQAANGDTQNTDPRTESDVNTAAPGPDFVAGPGLPDMNYRLVVEAAFTDLPAGATIVAPAARDRRYQKVSKSEHSGVTGAVMATEDGGNLFFVSEPTAAGAASYVGTFEVSRRVGTEGGIDRAKGQAFAEGKGAVQAGPGDAALTADAGAIGVADMGAFEALVAVVNQAVNAPAGADHATVARAAALLRLKGVPATVIGGYLQPSGGGPATTTHSWLVAELPEVGVTPIDPVLRAAKGPWKAGGDPINVGLISAARIEMVSGDALVIAAQEGANPKLELNGDLVAPVALKDGASVGKVTWSARFEVLPAKK